MDSDTILAFRDDVRVEVAGDTVSVASALSTFTLRPVRPATQRALRRLADGPTPVPALLGELPAAERPPFARFLQRAGHLVVRSVHAGGAEMLRLEHTARDAAYEPVELAVDTPVRLSLFAFCRSRAGVLVLESALAKLRVLLAHRAARELAAALGTATTPASLGSADLPVADVVRVLGHLAGAGFVDLGTATAASRPTPTRPCARRTSFPAARKGSVGTSRPGRCAEAFPGPRCYAGNSRCDIRQRECRKHEPSRTGRLE